MWKKMKKKEIHWMSFDAKQVPASFKIMVVYDIFTRVLKKIDGNS